VARALLGLGDLARLRSDPSGAHSRYLEALAILREIDARPDIARCLAGLARVAMDLGSVGQARQHLAESLRLSHSTGSRIGVARGLEAFAALAGAENRPELAVQLAAAAGALREAAGFPPLSGARAERYLVPGRAGSRSPPSSACGRRAWPWAATQRWRWRWARRRRRPTAATPSPSPPSAPTRRQRDSPVR
jgi:hypothetical protein